MCVKAEHELIRFAEILYVLKYMCTKYNIYILYNIFYILYYIISIIYFLIYLNYTYINY